MPNHGRVPDERDHHQNRFAGILSVYTADEVRRFSNEITVVCVEYEVVGPSLEFDYRREMLRVEGGCDG